MGYMDDPNYQQIAKLNQTANDLKQQNSQLNSKVDDLNNQIDNLNATIDDLNKKLDLMTMELLGAGIITLILVAVAIAVVYMTRPKRASLSTQKTL